MSIFKATLLIATLGLSSCHYLSFARITTQQGNVITEKQMRQLKVGMSKTDAAIALGNSLITPTFQKDRWDYAYTVQKGEGTITKKFVVLHFKQNRLTQIEQSN
jgi:outer membrane protein assembly factor BamE